MWRSTVLTEPSPQFIIPSITLHKHFLELIILVIIILVKSLITLAPCHPSQLRQSFIAQDFTLADVRTFFAVLAGVSSLTLLPTASTSDFSSDAFSGSVRVAANRKILARCSVPGELADAPGVESASPRGRFEARWTRSASAGLWERRRLTRIRVVPDIAAAEMVLVFKSESRCFQIHSDKNDTTPTQDTWFYHPLTILCINSNSARRE